MNTTRVLLFLLAIGIGISSGLMVFSFASGFDPSIQGLTVGSLMFGLVMTLIILVMDHP
jgi:hypothetical protein